MSIKLQTSFWPTGLKMGVLSSSNCWIGSNANLGQWLSMFLVVNNTLLAAQQLFQTNIWSDRNKHNVLHKSCGRGNREMYFLVLWIKNGELLHYNQPKNNSSDNVKKKKSIVH